MNIMKNFMKWLVGVLYPKCGECNIELVRVTDPIGLGNESYLICDNDKCEKTESNN
jgi:hypothetical protein